MRDRIGRFELAAGGTLFLDELGELPLRLQVKLLRVLQEKTFERVGESRSRQADVRIVAATNRNLRQAVLDGSFRDDLYYRLRVVPIDIAPLRSRREDIEPLSRHLLSRVGRRHSRTLRLAPETVRALLHHDWPGNVRELENALEYAVAVNRGQTVTPGDLPTEIGRSATSAERARETPAEATDRDEPAVHTAATNDNPDPMVNPFGPGSTVNHSQWTVSFGISWALDRARYDSGTE